MRRPAAEAKAAPVPASAKGMRMAELAARSGVARETIHFYLREGLLPRPAKGGRTVAYYGEEHLERLRLIRHLREDKYLPIAVIRRLLSSPAAERDLDVLADVLHIIPASDPQGRPPSAEAHAVAIERGLLGPQRAETGDPAERRVLEVVDQALALDEDTRRLTLADLEACRTALTALVDREAALFFDAMFQSGDVGGSIAALRGGRASVARYIAAYRDLLLRRIVEDVLVGLERGPELVVQTATVPLSLDRQRALGALARRAELRDALTREDRGDAAAKLVWHLFQTGAEAELAAMSDAALPPRESVLVAWGALATARSAATLAALARAVDRAPDFALGQILFGEAVVARGLRRKVSGASLLEAGIPALNRVFGADPDRDPPRAPSAGSTAAGWSWCCRRCWRGASAGSRRSRGRSRPSTKPRRASSRRRGRASARTCASRSRGTTRRQATSIARAISARRPPRSTPQARSPRPRRAGSRRADQRSSAQRLHWFHSSSEPQSSADEYVLPLFLPAVQVQVVAAPSGTHETATSGTAPHVPLQHSSVHDVPSLDAPHSPPWKRSCPLVQRPLVSPDGGSDASSHFSPAASTASELHAASHEPMGRFSKHVPAPTFAKRQSKHPWNAVSSAASRTPSPLSHAASHVLFAAAASTSTHWPGVRQASWLAQYAAHMPLPAPSPPAPPPPGPVTLPPQAAKGRAATEATTKTSERKDRFMVTSRKYLF